MSWFNCKIEDTNHHIFSMKYCRDTEEIIVWIGNEEKTIMEFCLPHNCIKSFREWYNRLDNYLTEKKTETVKD